MRRKRQSDTTANRTIDQLLSYSPTDTCNILSIAREYADHMDLKGQPHMPAGDRLLRQIEFALHEYSALSIQGPHANSSLSSSISSSLSPIAGDEPCIHPGVFATSSDEPRYCQNCEQFIPIDQL